MAVKSSSPGPFTIPTAPSPGTSAAQSASANTFGSYVQAIASSAAALFITGINVSLASVSKPTYVNVQIGTGGSGSEVTVGQIQLAGFATAGATGQQIGMSIEIWPPIPVANATRIAIKTASDVASALAWNVSLQCVAQANVVAEGVINETVNVIQVNGTAQTAGDIPAKTNSLTFTGAGKVDASLRDWLGTAPNALQTGRVDSYLGAVAGGVIAAASFAANALDAVWSTAARVLTAGTNIALAKGVGVTGFNDLAAVDVRAAIGEASASFDTQLAAIKSDTGAIPTANANADALLDRTAGVETGLTPRQWFRIVAAVLFGKASGMGSTTAVFRDTNDTKNRVSATVDIAGDRSSVTLDPS